MIQNKQLRRARKTATYVALTLAALAMVDTLRVINTPGAHTTPDNLYELCKRNFTCRSILSSDEVEPIRILTRQEMKQLAKLAPGQK